jgi:photosystem II stability/assembly factor-like uncharacterized protein
MNDGRLGHDLLDLTEPPPGLARRVLAGLPARRHRRRDVAWPRRAAGAASLLLAATIVVALLVARQSASARQTVPASAPAIAPPPASASGIAAVTFTSPSAGWVVQSSGISSTTDGGLHWTGQPGIATGAAVIGVWTAPGGVILAVTQEQGPGQPATPTPIFWRSTDGGAHWRRLVPPGDGSTYWGPISIRDGGEAWLVAQTPATEPDPVATVLHTTDGGQTWQAQATFHVKAALGPHVGDFQGQLTFIDSRRAVLAPGAARGPEFPTEPPYVFATADGGAHWSKVHLPDPPRGIDSTNEHVALYAPVAGGQPALVLDGLGPRRENLIGPGSTPEYVYATADGGLHWTAPHSLPGPAAPAGSRRLVVLDDAHWWWSTGGGVSFSADQGRHWTARAALPGPEQVADLGFANAADGWALAEIGAGAGRLFTTSDGGRTWTGVTPPDPVRAG